MNKRQARKTALAWLYYACEDPEAFWDFDSWLPLESDPEIDRDKMLDAFYGLQQEMKRRSGKA